jgi:prefoldin alpha subunit
MDSKQELEKLITELNQLQQQSEAIKQQIEQLNLSLTDVKSAEETLHGIKDNAGKETLVPIGAGCFISTELKSDDEVIMGVGSDVAVKKSVKEAKETLKEDRQEVEKLISTFTEQLKNITEYIATKRPEAEKLMKENGEL